MCMCICEYAITWLGVFECVYVYVHIAIWLALELIFIPIVVKDWCRSSPFSCLPLLIKHHFFFFFLRGSFLWQRSKGTQLCQAVQTLILFSTSASIYLNYQISQLPNEIKYRRVFWKLLSAIQITFLSLPPAELVNYYNFVSPHGKGLQKSLTKKRTEKSPCCFWNWSLGVAIC